MLYTAAFRAAAEWQTKLLLIARLELSQSGQALSNVKTAS